MLIISIILTICIFIIVGIVIYNILSKGSSGSSESKLNQLIKVNENGKYGYINTEGDFVIKPKYDEADDFYGNYAVVSNTTNKDGESIDGYQLIDSKGNVKYTVDSERDIEYIEEFNVWIIENQLYSETLKKLSADNIKVSYDSYYEESPYLIWENNNTNTAGIMTMSGKITYTYRFKNGENYFNFDYSENENNLTETYCNVNVENNKYGIVNCDTGKVVYDYSKEYISDGKDNIFSIADKDTYFQNDKIVYQAEKDNIDLKYESSGYIEIYDDDLPYSSSYTYYDIKNNKLTSDVPTTENTVLNNWEKGTGITEFECDDYSVGLKDKNKTILSCNGWMEIEYLNIKLYNYLKSNGKEYVMAHKDNGFYYIINLKDGKIVEKFNAKLVYDYDYSTFIDFHDSYDFYDDNDSEGSIVIYNLITGKSKTLSSNIGTVNHYFNYITVKKNSKKQYYNSDFKLIYTEDIENEEE